MRVEPAVGKTEKAKRVLSHLASFAAYDAETGEFIAVRQRRVDSPKVGQSIGTKFGNGKYLCVRIAGEHYALHTLAWLWMTGSFPQYEIDHCDGNGCNNAWVNLRDVPHSVNRQNSKKYASNKSGITGVRWDKWYGMWKAEVRVRGKTYDLGHYASAENAKESRDAFIMREQLPFTERHGH